MGILGWIKDQAQEVINTADKAIKNPKKALNRVSEKIADTAESAYDDVVSTAQATSEFVSNAAETTYEGVAFAAQATGEFVSDTAEAAYDGVVSAAEATYDGVVSTAQATGKFVSDTADQVTKTATVGVAMAVKGAATVVKEGAEFVENVPGHIADAAQATGKFVSDATEATVQIPKKILNGAEQWADDVLAQHNQNPLSSNSHHLIASHTQNQTTQTIISENSSIPLGKNTPTGHTAQSKKQAEKYSSSLGTPEKNVLANMDTLTEITSKAGVLISKAGTEIKNAAITLSDKVIVKNHYTKEEEEHAKKRIAQSKMPEGKRNMALANLKRMQDLNLISSDSAEMSLYKMQNAYSLLSGSSDLIVNENGQQVKKEAREVLGAPTKTGKKLSHREVLSQMCKKELSEEELKAFADCVNKVEKSVSTKGHMLAVTTDKKLKHNSSYQSGKSAQLKSYLALKGSKLNPNELSEGSRRDSIVQRGTNAD